MCERFLKKYSLGKVVFVRYARTCIKKPFGAGTKRCTVLLALPLVCNFYLLRMFIIWRNKMQAFHARKLWHFLF